MNTSPVLPAFGGPACPRLTSRLKEILDKFPKSADRIRAGVIAPEENPSAGDVYPGFPVQVRKVRVALKEY
jgi:hypothetical protein